MSVIWRDRWNAGSASLSSMSFSAFSLMLIKTVYQFFEDLMKAILTELIEQTFNLISMPSFKLET
jgi:hypothetical protein